MPGHRAMSGAPTWLRHSLREIPLARAAVVQLHRLQRPREKPDGVLFLFYHDMRASERGSFARQLRRMPEFGDVIGVGDALRRLAAGCTGERYVCLTFDDGCQGAFDYAFPILAERGVPAAFFVVPGWMDESRRGVFGWNECRRLAAGGMDVGAHSFSHRRIAALTKTEVEHDFAAARARIEAELGRPCLHLACPWGQPGTDYDPMRDPALARAAGYECFLTTIPMRARSGADPWSLPRVRMEPSWGYAELRYAASRTSAYILSRRDAEQPAGGVTTTSK